MASLTTTTTNNNNNDKHMKQDYIIHFTWKHQNFWKGELDSILQLFQLKPSEIYNKTDLDNITSPFMFATFKSEKDAENVCSRCLLINRIYKIYGVGKTDEEVIEDMKNHDPKEYNLFKKDYNLFDKKISWKINVGAFGKKINFKSQEDKRKLFAFIPFEGPVKLSKPDLTFWFIEEYTPKGVPSGVKDTRIPTNKYFLLEIANGRSDLPVKYSLKQRKFLGPTSMDAELAFIMANNALARQGSFVLDPFVGTGSIIVAAQAFGAYCIGTDIDIRILHAQEFKKTTNIFSNSEQYNLPKPCLIRGDMSKSGICMRINKPILDAIICDPPYGVRAGAKKSGSKREIVEKVPEKYLHKHIPQTQPYHAEEVMLDLLDLAATLLVMNGRLVYFLPVAVEEYTEHDIPRHDCLKLISNCEDRLGWKLARRLITMEKIKEPVDKKKDVAYYTDYREFGGVPNDGSSGSISANKQMNTMSLREKIMRGNDGVLNKKLREERQRKKDHNNNDDDDGNNNNTSRKKQKKNM